MKVIYIPPQPEPKHTGCITIRYRTGCSGMDNTIFTENSYVGFLVGTTNVLTIENSTILPTMMSNLGNS